MGLLARIFTPSAVRAAEGEYRPGPYLLNGGWLSAAAGANWNWWQTGASLTPTANRSSMVQACQSAYAQTVAMCPGDHWRATGDGGRERVTTSALTRIIRAPNDYQTISDFLMNLCWSLNGDGNAYALATRNARAEIAALHLMHPKHCSPRIAEDGSIFYDLGGNEIVDRRFGPKLLVPARDVLHVRLHTPEHPLKGVTPLLAAALDIAASGAMMTQQLQFFMNQARPSTVLTTDLTLTREQVVMIRELWEEQSKGLNAGGTPILSAGLKPMQLATASKDAQLAEIMKMSDQNIALAFRVPLAILGIGPTPFASTEMLMQSWIASGLGFMLNHIEEAFGQLFGLSGYPNEYLELNTRALLRSSFKERIEGLAAAVIGGIMSPDEARGEEDLPLVADGAGASPRVQQQVVPLSYGMDMKPPDPAAAQPAPAPAPEAPAADEEEEADDAERSFPDAIFARLDQNSRLH